MEQDTESKKTILIVEDNKDSRELAIKVLRAKGFLTIEAADAEEGLKKAAAEHPDLILMDISLPRLDGYQASRMLKEQDDLQDIPIIALTAHAMKGDREKALQAGCDGYITKPINIRELANQLRPFLKKDRPPRI